MGKYEYELNFSDWYFQQEYKNPYVYRYKSYTNIQIIEHMWYNIKSYIVWLKILIIFFNLSFDLIFVHWQIQIRVYLGWQERANTNTNVFGL